MSESTDLVVQSDMTLSGDPAEVQALIEALGQSVHNHLDHAYTLLQSDAGNIEEINRHIVAADRDMWKLSQAGAMPIAALAGMAEAMQVVVEQRNQLAGENEKVTQENQELQERVDEIEEDLDGAVFDRLAMHAFFTGWDDFGEIEGDLVEDIQTRAVCLDYEGQKDDAEALNKAIAAYQTARDAMVDLANASVKTLTAISNNRRADQGLKPLDVYLIPDELVEVLNERDADEEDDEDYDQDYDEDGDESDGDDEYGKDSEDPDDVAF